jgi:HAD superfamily hydrolase (TIGR01490 family)
MKDNFAAKPATISAAFFDVDGTLCATRSTTSLIWLRSRQHSVWKHRLWLASLIWRAPLVWLADQYSRSLADQMIYRQFSGLSHATARQDSRTCCDQLLFPSCFKEALEELEMHKKAGRRIILLSGGVELALSPLAKKLGAELLAQRLEYDGDICTGNYHGYEILDGTSHQNNGSQAERKLAALKIYADKTGIDLAASYAYGDSINDAMMLSATGHPVAVNPDRRLRKIAVASKWEIRRWEKKLSAQDQRKRK